MPVGKRHILVVGGGTSGAVMASRLSEDPSLHVTLLEAGPGHEAYDDRIRVPRRAADFVDGWGTTEHVRMTSEFGAIEVGQARMLGGTSAINGLATLRGQPEDYDGWAQSGMKGWAWTDVESTFIQAERDMDFPESPIHGRDGPLPVRRWSRQELSFAQAAFLDGMLETGHPRALDINDPRQLPGVGNFPVTIDEQSNRVSTSLAYLDEEVQARENLDIRTNTAVASLAIEKGRALGVTLASGEQVDADEVVVTAGAIWTAAMLLRSGVGPAAHLAEYGIRLHADLPVGSTMSDHLGAGVVYRHRGPRGGVGGPAQVVFVGASGDDGVDYHLMPISMHDSETQPLTAGAKFKMLTQPSPEGRKPPDLKQLAGVLKFLARPSRDATLVLVAALLLRSSNRGSVRLGRTPEARPVVVAPPLPEDGQVRLRHAFDHLLLWERSEAFQKAGLEPVFGHDLSAPDAVVRALEQNPASYYHQVGTCPMGSVLDADCRVHGIPNLRVADGAVMPTIPKGNTYLGCVMVAERIATKMKEAL